MKTNMKWYLLIGAVAVIGIATLAIVFLGPPDDASTTQTTPGLPVADSVPGETPGAVGTSSATITFTNRSSDVIVVKDFIHNGETIADTVNPGSHVLAGTLGYCLADGTCPAGYPTTKFSVSYNAETHFFTVVLLEEPLGTTRLEAEQFLIDRLGVTTQTLCAVDYSVGTPYWVNEGYAGKNLGFSFCPGATKLPH